MQGSLETPQEGTVAHDSFLIRLAYKTCPPGGSVAEWLECLDLKSVGRGFKSCSEC